MNSSKQAETKELIFGQINVLAKCKEALDRQNKFNLLIINPSNKRSFYPSNKKVSTSIVSSSNVFNQNFNHYVCIFPYAKSKQILVTLLTSIKFKNLTGSGLVYCLFVCSSDWVFIQLMFWIGKKATFPVLFSRFCQVLSCLHSSPSFSYVFSQYISTGRCTID